MKKKFLIYIGALVLVMGSLVLNRIYDSYDYSNNTKKNRYAIKTNLEEVEKNIQKTESVEFGIIIEDNVHTLEYKSIKSFKDRATVSKIISIFSSLKEVPKNTNIAGIGPSKTIELYDENGNSLVIFTISTSSHFIEVEKIGGKYRYKMFALDRYSELDEIISKIQYPDYI